MKQPDQFGWHRRRSDADGNLGDVHGNDALQKDV